MVNARSQGWGVRRGDGELVFSEDRVSVQGGGKFGRWMMVRVAQKGQCPEDH